MQTKLENKEITIYFNDSSNSGIARKDGTFLELTNNTILLRNSNGVVEGIPLYKVVRFVEKPQWGKR